MTPRFFKTYLTNDEKNETNEWQVLADRWHKNEMKEEVVKNQ